jgi:hypothetical protein
MLVLTRRETILYKSVQILAFAGDIGIIGRTQAAMKEAFINLKKTAQKMHLQINQEKIYASNQESLYRLPFAYRIWLLQI